MNANFTHFQHRSLTQQSGPRLLSDIAAKSTIESSKTDGKAPSDWRIEVFFDADCPLCKREVALIAWIDRRNRVLFTDIAAADFSPEEHGKTMKEFMDEIRGRLPDGSWIVGVEVFRQIYSAIGLGIFVWPTRLPLVRNVLNWGYRVFARNRLRLTGRCNDQGCSLDEAPLLADKKISE